ncbi:MAG TPA: peptidoglycan-binding domain-containing protein [Stellaceae bacterium]|nr:peptidoglycan-binding domain-containing protein [Stellaceae bacterium]
MRVIIAALLGVSLSATLAVAEEARIVRESPVDAAERQKVQSAQVLLHILGLYDGTTNGTLGPATRRALTTYQEKVGLPASGEPDQRTLFALAHPAAVAACGSAPTMADCLDSRARVAFDNAAPVPAARPAVEANPCADPKLPLEQCLQAVSKIDDFMKARGVAKK